MTKLADAIAVFPIVEWCRTHFVVHDAGGENFYINCPFCPETKSKAKIGVHRVRRFFSCFRCREGFSTEWTGNASVVEMICLVERVSKAQAIARIYSMAGLPDTIPEAPEVPKELIPKEAISLAKSDRSIPAVDFLYRRGVGHLHQSSYVCLDGRFADRVILPTNYLGKLTGFEAKSYTGKTPKALYESWFSTSTTLYTTQAFDESPDTVVITESVVDAETVMRNALGLYGSSLKEGQLHLLKSLRDIGVLNFIWMLDEDAWKKIVKILEKQFLGVGNSYLTRLPKGEDPNSLGHDECLRIISDPARCRLVKNEMDLVQVTFDWNRRL